MSAIRFIFRSLWYYRRTGVFIALGLSVAVAVIAGSLLMGDCMTASLRQNLLRRLGNVDHALISPHFFRAALAGQMAGNPLLIKQTADISAGIISRGVVRAADSDTAGVSAPVYGVDDGFWRFSPGQKPLSLTGRQAAISRVLAEELHLRVGDDLLLTVDRQGKLADQSLFARRKRESTSRTLRLEVAAVLDDQSAGGFGLDAAHGRAQKRLSLPRILGRGDG